MSEIIALFGVVWLILLVAVVITWLLCPFIAAAQGAKTGHQGVGFMIGLAFGPLGVLIAVVHRLTVTVDLAAEYLLDRWEE